MVVTAETGGLAPSEPTRPRGHADHRLVEDDSPEAVGSHASSSAAGRLKGNRRKSKEWDTFPERHISTRSMVKRHIIG